MPFLSKFSLILLALGILSAPFFVFAADTDAAKPASFLQTFSRAFDGFSLKDIDTRVYSRLQGEGGEITQTASHLCTTAQQYCIRFLNRNFCFYGPSCPPACSDEHDNDGDSKIDYTSGRYDFNSDPGCTSLSDPSERGTNLCDNGADDDGDGTSDYPADPGCDNPSDMSEYGPKQCDDGIDNDGDGGIDYRPGGDLTTGDVDCESLTDNSEQYNNPARRPPVVEVPQQAFNPAVDLYFDNNPSINSHTLVSDAYNTNDRIYWNVRDSCAAECSSAPNNWWSGTLTGSAGEGGSGMGYIDNISILSAGQATYTLTCGKLRCSSVGTNGDSVTITPRWSPSFSFSGPAQVNTNEHVNLIWSGNDIKSCSASGWSGPSTSALQVSNVLQNQDHSVDVGTISARKTYTLTCTGFNNVELPRREVTVNLITSPTPYFFINSINLIIIGPGSGGRSNKATIGITKGGGFTGDITLSAANATLTSAGAQLCLNATNGTTCSSSGTIHCTSSVSSTCDTTAEFWVEIAGDLNPTDYTVTLYADPVPSGFETKQITIPLRVRRFVPAFEEI